jgi:Ca2+-binding RTX toxin-like protein
MAVRRGTEGNDRLVGTAQADRLIGLGGNDTIIGRGGRDVARGGDGNDFMRSGAGNDRVFGDAGSDHLDGGGGNDVLSGGDGNDKLDGGEGNDTIDPGTNTGAGDDIYGSAGDDTIDFSAGQGNYRLDYRELTADLNVRLRANTGDVAKAGLGADRLLGLGQITGTFTFFGGSGNDVIRADMRPGLSVGLDGGAGDDLIVGGGAFDRLTFTANGDTGVTVQVTGISNGRMSGTAIDAFGGNDRFRAIEEISGSSASDTLTGFTSGDRFAASRGGDTIDGAGGSDDLSYDRFQIDVIDLDLAAGTALVTFSNGAQFTDTLISIEHVRGSGDGADRMFGSDAGELLIGLQGNNLINGRGGDDILRGGGGRDRIVGGDGADQLNGEGERDVLVGDAGNDRLTGGAAPDTFVFSSGDGSDRILDFQDGADRIRIESGADDFGDLTLRARQGNTVVTFDDVRIVIEDVARPSIGADDFLFA